MCLLNILNLFHADTVSGRTGMVQSGGQTHRRTCQFPNIFFPLCTTLAVVCSTFCSVRDLDSNQYDVHGTPNRHACREKANDLGRKAYDVLAKEEGWNCGRNGIENVPFDLSAALLLRNRRVDECCHENKAQYDNHKTHAPRAFAAA